MVSGIYPGPKAFSLACALACIPELWLTGVGPSGPFARQRRPPPHARPGQRPGYLARPADQSSSPDSRRANLNTVRSVLAVLRTSATGLSPIDRPERIRMLGSLHPHGLRALLIGHAPFDGAVTAHMRTIARRPFPAHASYPVRSPLYLFPLPACASDPRARSQRLGPRTWHPAHQTVQTTRSHLAERGGGCLVKGRIIGSQKPSCSDIWRVDKPLISAPPPVPARRLPRKH